MLQVETTINIGHIVTFITAVAGAIGVFFALRSRVDLLGQGFNTMAQRLTDVELNIKQLIQVLINQASQDERLKAMDQRLSLQGSRIDELSRRLNLHIENSE